MASQDKIVQEKVLTFKTLALFNTEEVAQFIAKFLQGQKQENEEESRFYSIINSVLVLALKSEWSFGLRYKEMLVGAYLQIDALDYLKICQVIGQQTFAQIFHIGQFNQYFKELGNDLRRGDFMVTIFNFLNPSYKNFSQPKQLHLIMQALFLIKIGGWKNIIFQTNNPVPFLKMNGNVIKDRKRENGASSYLMQINMQGFHLVASSFHKIYAKL